MFWLTAPRARNLFSPYPWLAVHSAVHSPRARDLFCTRQALIHDWLQRLSSSEKGLKRQKGSSSELVSGSQPVDELEVLVAELEVLVAMLDPPRSASE